MHKTIHTMLSELDSDVALMSRLINEMLEPQVRIIFISQFNTIRNKLLKILENFNSDQIAVLKRLEDTSTDIQYLVFDLEATRRERDKLRDELGDRA